MPDRTRDDVSLATQEAAPQRAGYDRDVFTWSQEQARLIREGRWAEIDRQNIAEEIESVGRTEFNRLESVANTPAAYAQMGSSAGTAFAQLALVDRSATDRAR